MENKCKLCKNSEKMETTNVCLDCFIEIAKKQIEISEEQIKEIFKE